MESSVFCDCKRTSSRENPRIKNGIKFTVSKTLKDYIVVLFLAKTSVLSLKSVVMASVETYGENHNYKTLKLYPSVRSVR